MINKKGFITIGFILISSFVLLIFSVIIIFLLSNNIEEYKFNRDVEKYKEDALIYMNKLEDDIEILNERTIYKKDFNIGDEKAYIITGKTKNDTLVTVRMSFSNLEKGQKYNLSTDYTNNKLNELIINNVYENTGNDYLYYFKKNIDIRKDYEDYDNYFYFSIYYSTELGENVNPGSYIFIDNVTKKIMEEIKKEDITVEEYLKKNYKEILKEHNVHTVEFDLENNYEYYNLYKEGKLSEDELFIVINDLFDFYKLFKHFNPDLDLMINFAYEDNQIKNVDVDNLEQEKKDFIYKIKEYKENDIKNDI